MHGDGFIKETASWEDCGCPSSVFIVRKPFSLAWTEELFTAIEEEQLDPTSQPILQFFKDGQDPDCVCQDSALNHAIILNNLDAVAILLQAGATCDFVPAGQPHGPSHLAAIQNSPASLELLLCYQADPNLPDRAGMRPLHHAMAVSTHRQSDIVRLLLQFGADPLKRDCWGDSGFHTAPAGECVAACMDQCWHDLRMVDFLQRHMEDIVGLLGSCPHLWCTCKAMGRQGFWWFDDLQDLDEAGGANSKGWSEERTELWESICFEHIDILRACPNLFQVLSDVLLQAADADADSWADVASHCKRALAAVSSSDSTPGEMEQSLAQTRKRLRIYFVHFRRLCDSTGLDSLGAIRTFPNPVEDSSKRTWESAVYHWRRLHTQPCGRGCLG